jgi:glycosyltransferase involved in cell wall biosynthesis
MQRHVVLVSGRTDHSTRYRCLHAAEQLAELGLTARVFHCSQVRRIRRALASPSVVILHRVLQSRWVEEIRRRAEDGGGFVLFDLDDNVIDPEIALHPSQIASLGGLRRALYRREVALYGECAARCSGLLVSTAALGRQASARGLAARIHRNGFSRRMLSLSGEAKEEIASPARVILGYASGTPTHDRDLLSIKPVLQDVLSRHALAELRLIGPVDAGDWGAAEPRIRRMPAVSWQDLPPLLAQFHVNLAPLEPFNRFNEAKSEVKFIEAALVGVPTVASAGPAYADALRHGETGLLAATPEEWLRHLNDLTADPVRRTLLGRQAKEDVIRSYHPSVRGRELLATLNEFSRKLRSEPIAQEPPSGLPVQAPVDGEDMPRPGLFQKACYALLQRGPGAVVFQAGALLQEKIFRRR